MKRTAHIEFYGPDAVKVTTPYKQRIFDLKKLKQKDCAVDLIKLKIYSLDDITSLNFPFWFKVGDDSSSFQVFVYEKSGNLLNVIGNVNFDTKEKIFTVNVKD